MCIFLNSSTPVLDVSNVDLLLQKLIDLSISLGKNILAALLVYIVGRLLVRLVIKLLMKMLDRRNVEVTVRSFLMSIVKVSLNILLLISVIGTLGVNTTSFAALIASAGVAIGMALSGNLQNFSGGLIILLFKPYKVGDWIEAQGVQGSVKEIQLFHTVLTTGDNKVIFLPNGSMSSAVVINYNREATRRVEWTFGVDYGQDIDQARQVIETVIQADKRILETPAPYIAVSALADSSVNILVRVWVNTEDYWSVCHEMNRVVYDSFMKNGIDFPYPQQTIHIVKD